MGVQTPEQQIEADDKQRERIRKRVASSKNSESIVRSLYNKIPTNVRLLVENLTGVDRPITAADFTEDELVEMVFIAEKTKEYNKKREQITKDLKADETYATSGSIADNIVQANIQKLLDSFERTRDKTSVDPYRPTPYAAHTGRGSSQGSQVDKGFLDSVYSSFTDPRYVVATSLGKYNAFDVDNKIAKIRDTYNFNPKERNLPTDFKSVLTRSLASPELAGEYLANYLGTESRDVNIDLPLQMSTGGMATQNTTTTGTNTVTSDTPYFDPTPEITPDEYQTRFIDFYNMPTITDPVVIGDEEEEEEQDAQPNVLAPVKSDEDRPTLFGAGVTLGGKSSFDFKTKDFNEVINDYVDPSKAVQDGAKKDKSEGKFGKFIADMYKTPEGAIGSGVGFMMGLGPLGGPALSAMAELNRKKQKETADAIAATGGSGGTMFELNGQLVYRKPGETIFSGVFEGTQKQMAGLEHMSKGFLPGMMKEVAGLATDFSKDNTYSNTGHKALATASGVAVDAYGTVVGSDGSSQNVSATQATLARNKFTTNLMTEMGYTGSQINDATAGKKDLSQQLKQALNEHMNQFKTGLFHRTSDVALGDYNQHLKEAKRFSSDFLKSKLGDTPAVAREKERKAKVIAAQKEAAETKAQEAAKQKAFEDSLKNAKDYPTGPGEESPQAKPQDYSGFSPGKSDSGGGGGGGGAPSGPGSADVGGQNRGFRALGGRVGLKEGGVAASQAGFVERPPSQVSEAATVADDKPMSVDDGTFVINAAAVEFAGEDDIARMLQTAYKKLGKQGKGAPSKEQIDIAVSRGEVIVPPAIAKIIGYDRLEKINNRGKAETSKRIKENGQPQQGFV